MDDYAQIREDVRRDIIREGEVLYEDERYMVGKSGRELDAHNLLVNDTYAFLPRNVFKQLAKTNIDGLRSDLRNVAPQVLTEMIEKDFPLSELGWALAKAALKEEEQYTDYLLEQEDSA